MLSVLSEAMTTLEKLRTKLTIGEKEAAIVGTPEVIFHLTLIKHTVIRTNSPFHGYFFLSNVTQFRTINCIVAGIVVSARDCLASRLN